MTGCPHPLSFAAIAEYLAGELGPQDEGVFEEHFFACAACTQTIESVSALTGAIRDTIPPALTATHLDHLRRSLRIRDTHVQVGQPAEAWFTPDVDLLIHALHVAPVNADRIDLEVYGALAEPFMRVEAVPFDADAAVVYVACQRHFRGDQAVEDTRFRLIAMRGGASHVLGDFIVRHHWGDSV